MKLVTRVSILTVSAGWLVFGQAPKTEPKSDAAPPQFEAADVHVSSKTANQFIRTGPVRDRRYEVKNATMVDLVRIAYGFDADKVLGGPNWLELDRFDVIAKVPPESTPETQKQMLRALLEERFKLAVHKDTQPLPTYVLTVGKKSQLKEASGSEETGCRPKAASGAPGEGVIRLMMSNGDGNTTTINLGPGMTIQYNCRNISMEAFAANLRGMIGASLGPNAVVDETGLKGNWNFDLNYSMGLIGPMMADNAEHISIVAAVEKQLGLKLEERQIPTAVLVVDRVNRTPEKNPPTVAEALPPIPIPTEFDVATIKPSDPASRMGRFQLQPGGRVSVERMPLRFLVNRAFDATSNDQVVGLPTSMENDPYDIAAKLPPSGASFGPMDTDVLAKPLLALLVDRFKLTYHKEDRSISAYSLMAAKPKMKKADPASRIFCRNTNAPPGAPPGTRLMKCQNITMAVFAERLHNMTQDLQWPVVDATGLEGGWDFTLTFNQRATMNFGPRMGDAGQSPSNMPSASEPVGGYTLNEAIEKELGLKLEKQKRSMSIFVIDHIEPKPTDN